MIIKCFIKYIIQHNVISLTRSLIFIVKVRLVDRQNKYEQYHDAIFNNLKGDIRHLRNTADLFLETTAKGDPTQDLKNTVHAMQTGMTSIETNLKHVDEVTRKNQKTFDQIPSVIDGKVSLSNDATGKEISMLKETIASLREDKKKEVSNLKAEITALREEIKNDVIALKADIKGSRSEYKSDLRGAMSMMYYRLLIGVFGAATVGVAAVQSLLAWRDTAEGNKNHVLKTGEISTGAS